MRKEKCSTCFMVHGGFHICIDLSTPEPVITPREIGPMSEEKRRSISEAQSERWAKIHAANAERDRQIIERYKEGEVGYMKLAEEFELNGSTVHKILKRAENDGLIEMRGRGMNINKKSRKSA